MVDWLSLAYRFPYPLRVAAASAVGFKLRRWRFGPETERLVAEALERETWGEARQRAWQEEKLARVLHRAATRVPFYRELWAERRRRGDRVSWETLESWPILEKETLRANLGAFLADDVDPARMLPVNTSGTSGTPITIWWTRETMRARYALFEARWRRWHGVSMDDRWALMGGRLVTPVERRKPPFWVWNAPLKQLYLSAFHLAPPFVPHYLEAMARYRVRYLWGYSTALYALALGSRRSPRHRRWTLRAAISNGEPLPSHQREAISEAFDCPVHETYGMAEMVAAASECAERRLHLWPEMGVFELDRTREPETGGVEEGDVVGTSLLNADMPFIRYRVGDRAARPAQPPPCACGRTLPYLTAVEGRIDDYLYTAEGRPVGRLSPVFKAPLVVREAQLVQETLGRVRVRYVPVEGHAVDRDLIVERLRERLGDLEVGFEEVDAIARNRGGKFRAVVCKLPPEARSADPPPADGTSP